MFDTKCPENRKIKKIEPNKGLCKRDLKQQTYSIHGQRIVEVFAQFIILYTIVKKVLINVYKVTIVQFDGLVFTHTF